MIDEYDKENYKYPINKYNDNVSFTNTSAIENENTYYKHYKKKYIRKING